VFVLSYVLKLFNPAVAFYRILSVISLVYGLGATFLCTFIGFLMFKDRIDGGLQ